jgi:hypothetical protein
MSGINYFASKVVRQPAVRVQHGEVGAAHIAHAQFLVAGSTRGVCKLLEIALKRGN